MTLEEKAGLYSVWIFGI